MNKPPETLTQAIEQGLDDIAESLPQKNQAHLERHIRSYMQYKLKVFMDTEDVLVMENIYKALTGQTYKWPKP